ncbi:hypothetical protein N2152v2_005397 [Parachlorella kessleri]
MPQDPPPVRSTRATARQQLFKAGEKRERAAPLTEVEALLASAGPAPEEPVRRRVAQQGASGLRPAVAAAIAGAGAAELAAAAVAEHAHEEGTDEDLDVGNASHNPVPASAQPSPSKSPAAKRVKPAAPSPGKVKLRLTDIRSSYKWGLLSKQQQKLRQQNLKRALSSALGREGRLLSKVARLEEQMEAEVQQLQEQLKQSKGLAAAAEAAEASLAAGGLGGVLEPLLQGLGSQPLDKGSKLQFKLLASQVSNRSRGRPFYSKEELAWWAYIRSKGSGGAVVEAFRAAGVFAPSKTTLLRLVKGAVCDGMGLLVKDIMQFTIRAGLTLEERTRRIEALYLWAARLTGNIWTTPGTLPASVGGIPTSLLQGVLNNKEARDVVLSRLPAELRDMLCERALGTDVVELVFAVTHGKLGSHFDLPTLRGSLASTSFVAGLAAQPEAERGFAMGPVSKSYACYSAEAGSSRWNDGTALPGGPRHGYHLAMHAKRAMRKANGSAQANLSSIPGDSEGIEALWEVACRWADSVQELDPDQLQEQLLRAAADVSSLLSSAYSDSSSSSEESDSEGDPPSLVDPHTAPGVAAAAVKAAQGLVTLLLKEESSAANPTLLERIAGGAVAVLQQSCELKGAREGARHQQGVVVLASMLLRLALHPTACPAAAQAALDATFHSPGFMVGLLQEAVQSLDATAQEQTLKDFQATQEAATYIASMLKWDRGLKEDYGRLKADKRLLQQLLRLAVVPCLADMLQQRPGLQQQHTRNVMVVGILDLLVDRDVAPHARELLAEAAPSVGSTLGSAADTGAAANQTATGTSTQGSTLGGSLVLLSLEALANLSTAWKQGSRDERRGRKDLHKGSEPNDSKNEASSAAAAAAAGLALLAAQVARLLALLPCAADMGAVLAFEKHHGESKTGVKSSGGGSGSSWNIQGSTGALMAAGLPVQVAAKTSSARAAEPLYLQGIEAVAAALHSLADCCDMAQLGNQRLPGRARGTLSTYAGVAAGSLGCALVAFQLWAEPDQDSIRWVPVDVVATCAAAEALIRLAPKLQQWQEAALVDTANDAHNLLSMASRWFVAVRLRASGEASEVEGRLPAQEAASAPFTAAQAQAVMLPAIHAAFTAIKVCHAAVSMCNSAASRSRPPLGRNGLGLEASCAMLMTAIDMAFSLRRLAYGDDEHLQGMPDDTYSKLQAMHVSLLDATGLLAAEAVKLTRDRAGMAGDDPGAREDLILGLLNSAMAGLNPGGPAMPVLAPSAVEAGVRLLLAQVKENESSEGRHNFLGSAAAWMEGSPRVCSKVVEGGVLSDSALWLARQLGQGQLSTPAAARLAGSLHAVFRGALRGLAQLFSGGGQPEGSHEVPPNLVALMADLHRASEAALGAGPEALTTPGFWRDLAAPGGLASLLKEVASTATTGPGNAGPASGLEGTMGRAALEGICCHRTCSHLGCMNLKGASESELGKGRRCTRCKLAIYCGIECQRAAWSQHKLICSKLSDNVVCMARVG